MSKSTVLKIIDDKDHIKEIVLPANTTLVAISTIDHNITTTTEVAIYGCEEPTGTVSTTIDSADNTYPKDAPHVMLRAGRQDEDGYVWLTGATLNVTNNGRIVGVNATPGYANVLKPIATKPWTRRDIQTPRFGKNTKTK